MQHTLGKQLVVLVTSLMLSHGLHAMRVSGEIELRGADARDASLSDAVVYFVPNTPLTEPATPGTHTLAMRKKNFVPKVLPVTAGSTVLMPNDDRISHNAFSPSRPNNFDLGLYGGGQEKAIVVNQAGVVRIYCNVHYHMVAYVVALDTPYYTQPDARGNFVLDDLPDVPGKLYVWHDRTAVHEEELTTGTDRQLEIALKITKRRIENHTNKFGQSYSPARRR